VETAILICSIALTASAFHGGFGKLLGTKGMRADARRFGFSYRVYRVIGGLEVAAALGILAGLSWWPFRLIAVLGLAALTVGAVVVHRRAGDPMVKAGGAGAVAVVALATAVLQLA
jgi:hypothetical protein